MYYYVSLCLLFISLSSYATKSRVEALGDGTSYGSFYHSDTRSIFKNPAYLNEYTNFIVTEWGDADVASAPHAEGGFFRSSGNYSFGVYLGNEQDANNTSWRSAFQVRDNQVDLFIAGDAGIQWGMGVNFASNNDEQTESTANIKLSQSSFGLSLGAIMGNMEGYVRADIKDTSEGSKTVGAVTANAADKFEADLGLTIGASYSLSGMTIFTQYQKSGLERTIGGVLDTSKTTNITAGVGKVYKVNDKARIYVDFSYIKEDIKTPQTTPREVKGSIIPVKIGLEADATSWLIVRGSIAQNVFGTSKKDNKNKTPANSATVAAGATLNFGKLKIDGIIGTDTTQTGAGTGDQTGVLSTSDVMTRVAVHYWF